MLDALVDEIYKEEQLPTYKKTGNSFFFSIFANHFSNELTSCLQPL